MPTSVSSCGNGRCVVTAFLQPNGPPNSAYHDGQALIPQSTSSDEARQARGVVKRNTHPKRRARASLFANLSSPSPVSSPRATTLYQLTPSAYQRPSSNYFQVLRAKLTSLPTPRYSACQGRQISARPSRQPVIERHRVEEAPSITYISRLQSSWQFALPYSMALCRLACSAWQTGESLSPR